MTIDHRRKPSNINPYQRNEYPDDSNFENLVDNWFHIKDNLSIFIGAGASIGAKNTADDYLPTAYELRNEIWKEFVLKSNEKDTFDFSNLTLMSLEHSSSIAEAKVSRKTLIDFISKRFEISNPLWHHCVLPFLSPKSIFTTNYDNLIDISWNYFQNSLRYVHIFNESDSKHFNKSFIPLYIPHGSVLFPDKPVKDGGIVITQFDYYEMMIDRKKMLEEFMDVMSNRSVIFIGYSFSDFDISSYLFDLAKNRSGPNWYAVFPRNDSDVRTMLFDKYRIRQINKTFFDFIMELDRYTGFIPEQHKFENCKHRFLKN